MKNIGYRMQHIIDAINKFATVMVDNIPQSKDAQLNVIREEAKELYLAYQVSDDVQILDGCVDTLWTGLVWASMNDAWDSLEVVMYQLENYDKYSDTNTLRQYHFDSFVEDAKHFFEEQKLESLKYMLSHLVYFARSYPFNFIEAFDALIDENLSKLDFPEGQKGVVFRNNKLQKKDLDGNLFAWYKPADFSKFIGGNNG